MFADNFKIVIPVDNILHTTSKPFCDVTLYPHCPCREDQESIEEIDEFIQRGLLTPEEATRVVKGHGL